MTHTTPRRGTPRALLQATPVALAVATMLMSSGAQAQDAAATQTVVVTGIRRGIESAINVKKNADGIVEAISAEDIGKLPDNSIAESIARLPGVTAQRVNGRAQGINIRGLSGDFANALLNGREQTSTGDNRGVEFDQYPSELLSAVVIYKTPDSALVGQGLSGTLDLQTVRPLSYSQRAVAVNLRGEKNGVGTQFKGNGSRFSFSYIDQFADRTIGVALGYARLHQSQAKLRSETYDTFDPNNGNSKTTVNGTEVLVNNGFKLFNDDTSSTRNGAMAVIEFKPNKNLTSSVDLFYSKFDTDVIKRGIEIQVNDSWKSCCANLAFQAPVLRNPVVEGGRLKSGIWDNVNPLSRTIWEPRRDELKSAGWNTKFNVADRWQAAADLNYSKATRREQITEIEAGVYDEANSRPLPGSVTVSDFTNISALQFDHGNPAIVRLTDPESWGQNGYDKIITTNDQTKGLRLSASHDMEGFLSRLNFGFNVTNRDKVKNSAEAALRLPAGTSSGGALPEGTGSIDVGNGFKSISFNPGDVYPSRYRLDANVNGDILAKGWTVNENIKTFYTKADIDSELFGMALRGNVGVQYIRSDQSSTAPVVDNTNQGQFTLRTAGKKYGDFLPSLNLSLDLGFDAVMRTGIGKQMARPRMDQLKSFTRSEVNNDSKWTGSGGNPLLNPFRATALDVSFEKYFGTKGYISAAGFYKDLKSYIFDFKDTGFDFTGFPNLSGRIPTSNIGEFTQPRNGKGGRLSGFELAASLPLNMLTQWLDGFGVQANYSNTSSAIKPFGDSDVRPLPGLSKTVYTLTAYYEAHGFSARVANRHRSSFIAEIQGFGADRDFKFARGESILDLQFGYEFQAGVAKGLSFLLQINNATNEPYQEFNGSTDSITKTDKFGKTVLFGANYKF